MNQFFEAVGIALSAIWANKLRSFLTVLGNIVAVTSIIAVVSLIQGLNAHGHGRDRRPRSAPTRSRPALRPDHDERGGRGADRGATRASRSTTPRPSARSARSSRRVMARGRRVRARSRYRDHVLESVSIRGVTRDYVNFSTYNDRAGPAASARARSTGTGPVALLGWDTADRLFGRSTRSTRSSRSRASHFRVVGVAEKKGSIFGTVAGRVRGHPARRVPEDLRRPAVAAAHRQAERSRRSSRRRWTTRRWRCGSSGG